MLSVGPARRCRCSSGRCRSPRPRSAPTTPTLPSGWATWPPRTALWGRPTWGAWWVWDARLTSELILLFLYGGFLALVSAIDDTRRADRAGALLAIVGSINVPIIYFSVICWNTLHQGASVSVTSAPKMASVMLLAMLLMTLSFWAYAFAVVFVRARAIALERDNHAAWANDAVAGMPARQGATS